VSHDPATKQYRFDRFVAEPDRRQLLVDGEAARIGARAFDILVVLIERRNRLVRKRELLDLVWPDVTVEEGNLAVQIFALRRLLGPSAIITIPGRGYQFVLPIEGQTLSASPPHAPAQEPAPTTGNLPRNLPPLYGRDADVAALAELISDHRLVSIVGPPGIGKTRLAQAVAHERRGSARDGAWIVELAPIESPELVLATIVRTLGLPVGPSGEALAVFARAIAAREILLVLDNCEHLTDTVSELAAALMAAAPELSLIVTSRAPLRLPEERVYRLNALEVPAKADLATAPDYGSVALFVARAQSADERFRLGEDNVGAVVEICARLEGIPLAIELAAARVHSLGVHSVRQHLNELLRLLVSGARAAPERHRALSTALSWSYELLSPEERRVLDLLGVFVGGFSLRAAQELIADERIDAWTALDHLSTLVESSLVIVDPGEPPRYRLLETTRAFALGRLTAAGELAAARRRHALALVATLRSESFHASPVARNRIIAPEINNLRAAAAWALGPEGDPAIAVELMAETDFIWFALGYNDEAERLFRAIEPLVDASTQPESAAKFWLARAKLYSAAMETAAAAALRAAEVFRALGNREALFDALTYTTAQFSYAGDHAAAERAVAEAGAVLDPAWPGWTRVTFEFWDSHVKYWAGRVAEAREQLLRALELNRGADGDAYLGEQLTMLLLGCEVTLQISDVALPHADALLARNRPPITGATRAIIESFRVAALAQSGDLERAEASLRDALPRFRQAFGTLRTILCHVAYLLARQGRWEDTARILGAVDALRRPGAPILSPPNRASYEGAAVLAAQVLGEGEFERLKAAGGALSEAQAIALALPDGPLSPE